MEQVKDNKYSISVEQLFLNDLADEERKALINKIKAFLTETQFRRLWLYYAEGKTEQQIADIEKVGQRRISTSINVAKKKIKKFFQNNY